MSPNNRLSSQNCDYRNLQDYNVGMTYANSASDFTGVNIIPQWGETMGYDTLTKGLEFPGCGGYFGIDDAYVSTGAPCDPKYQKRMCAGDIKSVVCDDCARVNCHGYGKGCKSGSSVGACIEHRSQHGETRCVTCGGSNKIVRCVKGQPDCFNGSTVGVCAPTAGDPCKTGIRPGQKGACGQGLICVSNESHFNPKGGEGTCQYDPNHHPHNIPQTCEEMGGHECSASDEQDLPDGEGRGFLCAYGGTSSDMHGCNLDTNNNIIKTSCCIGPPPN